ncbi:hypothetical protein G1C95_1416 [Bifidobacterium sp. DSM 109957]|uniref:Lipoprotein n=2 Tax=Bifidobacterium oedipodis TaxID=2675322 RepID=A0A7Y0EPU6_9BIFI|nr:hypothetical protein [Bifidobacterium sp. DSM 109957]
MRNQAKPYKLPMIMTSCMLAAMLLCGCGNIAVQQEEFTDDAAVGMADIAQTMLSDDRITRSETQQAIENIVRCYEERSLAGEYAVNLDIYPWMFGGSIGLSTTHPDFQRLPDILDDETRKLAEQQGSIISRIQSQCNAPYQDVYDWIFAHADLSEYELKRYEDVLLCTANAAPTLYRRIDSQWREHEDRDIMLSQIKPYPANAQEQAEYERFVECQVHGTTPLVTFGVS